MQEREQNINEYFYIKNLHNARRMPGVIFSFTCLFYAEYCGILRLALSAEMIEKTWGEAE